MRPQRTAAIHLALCGSDGLEANVMDARAPAQRLLCITPTRRRGERREPIVKAAMRRVAQGAAGPVVGVTLRACRAVRTRMSPDLWREAHGGARGVATPAQGLKTMPNRL
jgi:hypothetical protein